MVGYVVLGLLGRKWECPFMRIMVSSGKLVWTQGAGPSVKVIREIDFWTLVPFYIIKPGNILLLMISASVFIFGEFWRKQITLAFFLLIS